MFKKTMLLAGIAAALSVGAEEVDIRNICDTLPHSKTPKVNLRLAYLEVSDWSGPKDLSVLQSLGASRHKDYNTLKPYRDEFPEKLPVLIQAGCAESHYNSFHYAQWNKNSKSWSLNDENNDYATYIMDMNMVTFPGYNSENSFNMLALRQGSLPEDGAYSSGELMISKSFEFQFDWWYAMASYKKEVKEETEDGTTTKVSYSYSRAIALDSASCVQRAVKNLNVPPEVSDVNLQIIHGVLMDENKIPVEVSSSSSLGESIESSSSDAGTTAIGLRLDSQRDPSLEGAQEIRSLNGAVIKSAPMLPPSVYYLKGGDGRWKKHMVLPR